MTREEIKNILPHREPMLLVDEIVLAENVAYGKYTVRGDEFFLNGHFPENPVVPGVILCEMMGQAACLLIDPTIGKFTPYFTGMNHVKFKSKVFPGDTVEFRNEITGIKGNFYFIKGEGSVNGKICLSGEMSFAVVKGE